MTYAIQSTDVAVAIIVQDRDGRVLAVSRQNADGTASNVMALPGGHVNVNETPEIAVIRELREETCLVIPSAWPCCYFDKTTHTWPNVVLDSPEHPGVKVHIFRTGGGRQGNGFEGPAGDGELGGRVKWLTPPELLERSGPFRSSVQWLIDHGCLESQFNASAKDGRAVAMDLGVADVHVPGASGVVAGYSVTPGSGAALGAAPNPDTWQIEQSARARENAGRLLSELPTDKRNALPTSAFAWPEQRSYPVENAAHVRNAAARLAQQVKAGKISRSTAAKIHRRIVAAGKKFGVEVSDLSDTIGPQPPVMHPGPLSGRMQITVDHPKHGHFEIRHMKDGTGVFRQVLRLSADAANGDGPVWNQIATRGTFKGHGAGEFTLDDNTYNQIIDNYRNVDGGNVHFDYEHCSEAEPTEGTIPISGSPAQAWIHDLKIMPEGLFALVRFLEPLKTQIREEKYRFVSPAIRFGAIHPVTGKTIGARLTSVAATNSPFLRGLRPLAAKDVFATDKSVRELRLKDANTTVKLFKGNMMTKLAHDHNEALPKIREALGLHPITTPAEVMERCRALREMCATADAGGMSGGVPVADYCDRLTDVSDVPMGATVEDVFDAVEAMIQAAIDEQEAAAGDGGADEGMKATLSSPPAEARMGDDMKAGDMATSKAKMDDDMKAKMDDAEMATSKAKMAEEEAAKAKMDADMATSKAKMAEEEASKAKMGDGGDAATSKAKMAEEEAAKAKKDAEMATSKAKMAADASAKAKMDADMATSKMNAALSAPKDELARQFTMKDGRAVKMTNEEIMADSIALKEVSTKLSAAQSEVASLTLKLNERETKNQVLEAEIVRLKADGEARDKAEIESRVNDAFETHKDAQKLTDKHRNMMLVLAKADRKTFDEVYPVLRGPQKFLMRDLTGGGKDVARTSNGGAEPPPPEGVLPGETPNDTAVRLTLADAKLDLADAQILALKMHAGR